MLRMLWCLCAVTPLAAQVQVLNPSSIAGNAVIYHDLARASDLNARFASTLSGDFEYLTSSNLAGFSAFSSIGWGGDATPPSPWAQGDPADSLYRQAREALNTGDYRRAATLFGDLQRKYPRSAYTPDSPYWEAFALYRLGSTKDLQDGLAALERWRTLNPAGERKNNVVTRSSASASDRAATVGTQSLALNGGVWSTNSVYSPDVAGLSARIAGVLASRGLGQDPLVKQALADRGSACDSEDLAVRAEALNALMQNNAEQGRALATRILARRDDCSVPLRRNALIVVANRRDAAGNTAALTDAARNDPSMTVRVEAINWLRRDASDAALAALEELARSPEAQVQRAAIAAIGGNPNPRARVALRGIVERAENPEPLRLSALEAFGTNTTTNDDAAWLRSLYPRAGSLSMQLRIVGALSRSGGEANDNWLLALARKEDEPAPVRTAALDRLGKTLDIAALGRFYDTAPSRQMRESLVTILSHRTEPEAVDKLIDIVRNGTDPNIRRVAIAALARSKDPRAAKLLLDLVDR